ncbi:MAG: hypothetical protein K0S37_2154 [Microbacterium sp.]|nr:hypothetical protein [Microbacterium sp.]
MTQTAQPARGAKWSGPVLLVAAFLFNAFATYRYLFALDGENPVFAFAVVGFLWAAWVAVLVLTLRSGTSPSSRRVAMTVSGICVAVAAAASFLIR